MNTHSNLLDDIEIADVVVFRNGGKSVVSIMNYETVFDGYEVIELAFDGHLEDAWYYELDGMLEATHSSAFDIIEVIKDPKE